MWFDDNENILRTITSILTVKNYLENKNIDFVMFEGIGTIADENTNVFTLDKYNKLLSKTYINSILNDKTFFNKYGPMQPFLFSHPLFDPNENDVHPNIEFAKWWADEMYEDIKNKQ